MAMVGGLLVVIGLGLHIFTKANMTQGEREELAMRRQRRQRVAQDFHRPLSEREFAHIEGVFAFFFSPPGLLIGVGIVLILIGVR